MTLYDAWKKEAYEPKSEAEYENFWKEYLPKEQTIYEYILSNRDETVSGTLKELAERFEIDTKTFIGFMDGINSSLVSDYDVEALEEDSEISLDVDMEKLYFNMHDAKADWLYGLPQWDKIFDAETKKRLYREQKQSGTVRKAKKIGRNDPCPCGSGKKYKFCCGKNA